MFEAAIRINTVKKYTRDEIFDKLKSILVEDFEIEEEKIQAETNLFEDLELDSIDAVDLAVILQGFHKRKSLRKTSNKLEPLMM